MLSGRANRKPQNYYRSWTTMCQFSIFSLLSQLLLQLSLFILMVRTIHTSYSEFHHSVVYSKIGGVSLCFFIFLFWWFSTVHPIGFEFDKPSDMITAVRISLALCAAIYFSVGLFGYLLFGESIMSDILINFDQSSGSAISSLLNDLVRLSYALHLMLVFPMLNFSLRANIDELLFSQKPLLAKDTKRFLSITLVLLVFSYTAAITIPDIWYFFQFLGSTSAVCLAFIFPGVIVLRYFIFHARHVHSHLWLTDVSAQSQSNSFHCFYF